jgi:hypothetical protein
MRCHEFPPWCKPGSRILAFEGPEFQPNVILLKAAGEKGSGIDGFKETVEPRFRVGALSGEYTSTSSCLWCEKTIVMSAREEYEDDC